MPRTHPWPPRQVHIPGRATLYCLVPLGASCGGGDYQAQAGHSHSDPVRSSLPRALARSEPRRPALEHPLPPTMYQLLSQRLTTLPPQSEMPNAVDPLGGWTDTGVIFTETNGIVRGVWQKPASGSYTLYHTVRSRRHTPQPQLPSCGSRLWRLTPLSGAGASWVGLRVHGTPCRTHILWHHFCRSDHPFAHDSGRPFFLNNLREAEGSICFPYRLS